MRHFLAPGAVARLAGGVMEAPAAAVLIAVAGRLPGGVPGAVRARPRAIAIAAIAAPAEEEDLPTVRAGADHKPERVHAPPRRGHRGGQSRAAMRRRGAESRAPQCVIGPGGRGCADSGPSPFRPSRGTIYVTSAVPATAPSFSRTAGSDSRAFSRPSTLLRGDLLPRVWIPPTALREARELIRHRIQLVWLRGVIRNRLPAMLARRNLQPTSGQSWLTQRGQRELQRLPLAETPSRIREDYGALLPTLDAQIRRLDADLVTRWGADPRVRRLTTIPGIGPFIAIVLVLELGDLERFASAKRVASYVGLTPRVRGSAGRVRAGHITKEGNRRLRWVLVLAATQAVRRPGPLRAWFHAVKKRRGKKVARVALARRLAEIVFHVCEQELGFFSVLRPPCLGGVLRQL